ncbi:MAG: response regulator, partial [Chloroflexi bacterium]|nr:response regulator [Chloroflexota bacterium]
LRVLLATHGYKVAVATNGAEALEAARRDRPDMIIADIMMPVMDGFSLCREWKRDAYLQEIPFVFYTATFTDPRDEEFALSLGAERFIVKPTEPDVFVGILLEVIRKHEAGRLVVHGAMEAEETVYLKEYNATLIRKLEDKIVELEEANQALKRDIAERKRVEGQLKASLREKEVLLREIHHRVKNNLQVLSSLLALQAGSIKNKAGLAVLTESRSRVVSMALIHEQLHRSKDLARIDFADYVRTLTTQLFRSYGIKPGQIGLQIAVDPVLLGIDQAIPCGLIINELVSNALKHAFPLAEALRRPAEAPAEIQIALHSEQEGPLTLTVSDTGIGLPQAVDLSKPDGLGLQLVTTLTRQLHGAISLERVAGTIFRITFPYPAFIQSEELSDDRDSDPDR